MGFIIKGWYLSCDNNEVRYFGRGDGKCWNDKRIAKFEMTRLQNKFPGMNLNLIEIEPNPLRNEQ